MRTRFWALNALNGTKQGEIDLLNWQASHSLHHTGDLSGDVSLNLTTLDGKTPDYPAIRALKAIVHPWLNTVVVTGVRQVPVGPWSGVPHSYPVQDDPASKRLLGEYIIEDEGDLSTDSPLLSIVGISWDQYPRYLTMDRAEKHTAVDAGWLAHRLLTAAFAGAGITFPAAPVAGWTVDMDREVASGPWMDAIDEVCKSGDGIEWTVDVQPIWEGEDLVGVTRTLLIGIPTLQRASSVVYEAPEPLTTAGNCVIIGGGRKGSQYARKVWAIGSGEGDKQLISPLEDNSLTNRGYLNASTAISRPELTTKRPLDEAARWELDQRQPVRGGQRELPRAPYTIEARLDDIEERPRLGDVVRVLHRMSWAHPGTGGARDGAMAIDEQIRVGSIEYAADSNVLHSVTIKVA